MTSERAERYGYSLPTLEARRERIVRALATVPVGARVLDVGAGHGPYRALFEDAGCSYLTLDVAPPADVLSAGESLPIRDASLDLVACFQVLEHVEWPDRAIVEFHRVLRPGGRVLLTTHGSFPYHPHPDDYWRWTAAGLTKLFERAGFDVRVDGLAGSATALTMLTGYYVSLMAKRHRRLSAVRRLIPLLNSVGLAVDRRVPELSDPWRDGTLFCNYFVEATKPS